MRLRRGARDPALDLRVRIRSVISEKGTGSVVRRLHFERGPVDRPASRRGGVPVLRRPSLKPDAGHGRRKAHDGLLVHPTCGDLAIADMDQAAQERAGGQDDGAACQPAAINKCYGRDRTRQSSEISSTSASMTSRFGLVAIARYGPRIELPISLRARTANCGAFAPVEKPELNASRIGRPAHQSIERVDFADEMPFAQAANCRITGHDTDRIGAERDQCRARARACSSTRCLAAGVATADYNDIIMITHPVRLSVSAGVDKCCATQSMSRRAVVSQRFT